MTVRALTRRDRVLRAVKLCANGARTDVVVAAFRDLGIDVCGNPDHLRAVAQLAVCSRMGEAPTEEALELLDVAS